MKRIQHIISTAVPIPMENIDTDQIIPARFLKATSKKGFGKNLFRDWSYNKNGEPIQDFILNNHKYKGNILLAGDNFGCGSSREHAAWAIKQYGFDVVVSSFFADIFKGNALNNSLLPVQLTNYEMKIIFDAVEQNPQQEFEVNLVEQFFSIVETQHKFNFSITSYKKLCLIEGLDDVSFLQSKKEEINAFYAQHKIY
jgi:3-isopropylmalate/(R)-2-methylmalate dehydratase small subunit